MAYTPKNPNGSATSANSSPVVVASDQAAIPITDNSGSLTVDGTVTANLSATDNAVLDAIEADTTTLAGAVSGTEMQVDIVSAPTLTVNAHAVTNAGTFVVQENGAALTALQLIDDTVATDGAATPTKGVLMAGQDGTNAQTVKTDSDGNLQVDVLTMPTVAVTQSGTWDEIGINDSGNSITVDNAQLSVVGSGTEAAAMRVTIASDSTGVLSVDDNGSTLSVDDGAGSLTVDATNLDIRDIDAATDDITVHGDVGVLDQLDLTNSNPAAVAIVDGDGTQITSFGGGTQYTEDAAAAANPVGTALMLVREDGRAGSLTTTDGDNVAARGNNKGELYVKSTDSDALLTTIDADTGNISTKIDTVAGAVSGTEMQVDVLTMPTVTVTDGLNVEGDIAAAATDSGNPVKIGGKYNSTMPTYTDGQRGNAEITTRGSLKTSLFVDNSATAIAAAVTNADGAAAASVASRLETISRMSVFNGSTWDRARGDTIGTYTVAKPTTSGGLSIFRSLDIDETEEDIKTSAGQLYWISAFNRTAAPLYLKFYNATAANVTVGTTTPVMTFVVPGNADSDGAGFVLNFGDIGVAFGTAISVACTTGVADNDTGAPGANDCVINIGYA